MSRNPHNHFFHGEEEEGLGDGDGDEDEDEDEEARRLLDVGTTRKVSYFVMNLKESRG